MIYIEDNQIKIKVHNSSFRHHLTRYNSYCNIALRKTYLVDRRIILYRICDLAHIMKQDGIELDTALLKHQTNKADRLKNTINTKAELSLELWNDLSILMRGTKSIKNAEKFKRVGHTLLFNFLKHLF